MIVITKYSLVVPAYNEQKLISRTIGRLFEYMNSNYQKDFEIIFVDDGSEDSTVSIIKNKIKKYPQIKLIQNIKNMGYGAAIKKGMAHSKGKYIVTVDADLSFELNIIKKIFHSLEKEKFDVAISSKHCKGASTDYSLFRKTMSEGYSIISKTLLGLPVKDAQCGPKGFQNYVVKNLFRKTKNKRWGWETEVICRAAWEGYNIKEIPLKLFGTNKRHTSVRFTKDSLVMGFNLLWLLKEKIKYKRRKRKNLPHR